MTQERRSDCLAHASLEATLGSMNEKIDLILERQQHPPTHIYYLQTLPKGERKHSKDKRHSRSEYSKSKRHSRVERGIIRKQLAVNF